MRGAKFRRGRIRLIATLIAVAAFAVAWIATATARADDELNIVPQLELTDLMPIKVVYAPNDETLLLVVNRNGRIDVFDTSNPGRLEKLVEIGAAARDAAFMPGVSRRDQVRIVSGGEDGTVRLWTLEGMALAEPFKGHEGPVYGVGFSPDGTRIVSGGEDGTVQLSTLEGTAVGRPFKGHVGGVSSVDFSPDGHRIVSGGSDGTVRLWTPDGIEVGEPISGHKGGVSSVDFSPDLDKARVVSGGVDGTVRLWTTEGTPVGEPFKGHDGRVSSIAFSPDGTRIVSGGEDGTVRLWTPEGKAFGEPFKGHKGPPYGGVKSVGFSPNGMRIISGGDDGTVRLWTSEVRSQGTLFKGQVGMVVGVDFSLDDTRIVLGDSDGTVRLWTLEGQAQGELFKIPVAGFRSFGFSSDGQHIVSGGFDGTVRLWTLEGKAIGEPFMGHEGFVNDVGFSPDGKRVVSGGEDGTVRLWTLEGKALGEPFSGHDGAVIGVSFSPDGTRIISLNENCTARLWSPEGKALGELFKNYEGLVTSVDFSPDGKLIVSGEPNGTVRLWTLEGEAHGVPFKGIEHVISRVAFSHDGTHIASADFDGTVQLYSLEGKALGEPFKGLEPPASVAFSQDGTHIVSGGFDGSVQLYSLEGKARGEPFMGHEGFVNDVGFSPDGKRVVSGGEDGTVRLWTLEGKALGEPFSGHNGAVRGVSFSRDGTHIVSGGEDGTVRLWSSDGKAVGEPFKGHIGGVWSVAFSPDSAHIVSGGEDGTVRLWTLEGKKFGEPFTGHKGGVPSVNYSQDGARIVSVGGDGTIRLWTLEGGALETLEGHGSAGWSAGFSPDGRQIVYGSEDNTIRLWDISEGTNVVVHYCQGVPLGYFRNARLWVKCGNRISIFDESYKLKGGLFLHDEGIVASIPSDGVLIPSERVRDPFRGVRNGEIIWQRGIVPELEPNRARNILLDDWSTWQRIERGVSTAYAEAGRLYQRLGWWKVPFWPFLFWILATGVAAVMWLVVPHRLAQWAMPVVGRPELPTWKWLAQLITFFVFLGTTRRPLRKWLRRNRDRLYGQCFGDREPVRERSVYCDLGQEAEIEEFCDGLRTGRRELLWISGAGGSGKSSLAFEMVKRAIANGKSAALPVLIDEDWKGSLQEFIARSLRVGSRAPTPKMVENLGAHGYLCPVFDSLSERSNEGAANDVARVLADGKFKSLLVTSRTAKPEGAVWERFSEVEARLLTAERLPDYVRAYAPVEHVDLAKSRIATLVRADRPMSPLFMRFAIEQALKGEVTATSEIDLVVQYVEALRADKIDLDGHDMLRAAKIVAREALRESASPREREYDLLRGVLISESDKAPFMDAAKEKRVDPAKLLDMLVTCGLLNRNRSNRNLQFAYDPVAEVLASSLSAETPALGKSA